MTLLRCTFTRLLRRFCHSIVAISGIASHGLGAWKSRSSSDVWLRDYLPQDIQGIRILLYGCETSDHNFMDDHPRHFLESLKAFRRATDVALFFLPLRFLADI